MKILTLLLITFFALNVVPSWAVDATCTQQKDCKFTWDANPEPDMKEYHLYVRGILEVYGDAPSLVIPHPTTEVPAFATTLNLPDGEYAVMVRAVDQSGNESGNSNELTVLADATPPQPVRQLSVIGVATGKP